VGVNGDRGHCNKHLRNWEKSLLGVIIEAMSSVLWFFSNKKREKCRSNKK